MPLAVRDKDRSSPSACQQKCDGITLHVGEHTMVTPLPSEPFKYDLFPVEAGSPHPLGATPSPSGVNFSLASSNATGVDLLLFSAHDSLEPFQTIRFDPYVNKTFHFWHVFVRGLKPGAIDNRNVRLSPLTRSVATSRLM
jgi:hypothetical protein